MVIDNSLLKDCAINEKDIASILSCCFLFDFKRLVLYIFCKLRVVKSAVVDRWEYNISQRGSTTLKYKELN